MTGLKSGTVYKVRLYKYIKTKGRCTYGEPIVYTTATNPPPVRSVKISTGKTTADVSWSRPSNCQGYTVMFYTGSGKNAKQINLNDGISWQSKAQDKIHDQNSSHTHQTDRRKDIFLLF